MQPLHVWDHVTHPHKTADTITVLHILIFMFSQSKCEDINLLNSSHKLKLLYNQYISCQHDTSVLCLLQAPQELHSSLSGSIHITLHGS
jgi:hypothetical protein